MSPIAIPGPRGMALSNKILPPQISAGLRRLGVHRPLVWVTCPTAVGVVSKLRPAGVVYERTDRWESFPEADPQLILACHQELREMADVTLYCSTLLYEEERDDCRNAVYVDHGVDFDVFERAGREEFAEPADLRNIPRPRVGFVGAIDESTFDPGLFEGVARALSDVNFVLVGDCSISGDWTQLPNIFMMGRRPYSDVPAYMASCDVLMMPWNRSDWIRACNPVKLKEYLAVGRPIVSTSFFELKRYEGFVCVADGATAFGEAIRRAVKEPYDADRHRARVRDHTWANKAAAVIDALEDQGIRIG